MNFIYAHKAVRFYFRLFGHEINLQNMDCDYDVLCPQETMSVKQAGYIPTHLARIKGTHESTVLSHELECINARDVVHHETRRYHVKNVQIKSGLLILRNMRYMNRLSSRNIPRTGCMDLEFAELTDSHLGSEYFGHWLRDDLTTLLMSEGHCPSIRLSNPDYPHASGYLELLNLKYLCLKEGLVQNLSIIHNFSENSLRINKYKEARDRLFTAIIPRRMSSVGVFLRRGKSGGRRYLQNENELIEHLDRRGFLIIDPEELSVRDIVNYLWDAPLVVSVEGSAINHALYTMALNGSLVVLQPPYRFNNVHKSMCDAIGRTYSFYVCLPGTEKGSFVVDSFRDLDNLLETTAR